MKNTDAKIFGEAGQKTPQLGKRDAADAMIAKSGQKRHGRKDEESAEAEFMNVQFG
jgi:hypothetical protein